MDFTAIDFETATSKKTSICSLGICVVEKNAISECKEFLFRPEPYEFNDYNIRIHGLTPADVCTRKTFNYYWRDIYPYLHNRLVIAHNTQFDIGALCASLDMFHLKYPVFDYMCTVQLSQKAYPQLPSHKLNSLCEYFGIRFHHHNARDDAYACARILLNICNDFNLDSAQAISKKFRVSIGHVPPSKRNHP